MLYCSKNFLKINIRMKISIFVIIILIITQLSAYSDLQQKKEKQNTGNFITESFLANIKHNSSAPIKIEAQKISGSYKSKISLIGNVSIFQDNMTIKSNIINLIFKEDINKKHKLASIFASGKVHITKIVQENPQDILTATADELEYNVDSSQITLRNNAKIIRNDNCRAEGNIIEYNLQEGFISGNNIKIYCTLDTININQ